MADIIHFQKPEPPPGVVRDDKGACYLERPDEDRIIVTVRSPGDARESKISIPINDWRKMIRVEWNPDGRT